MPTQVILKKSNGDKAAFTISEDINHLSASMDSRGNIDLEIDSKSGSRRSPKQVRSKQRSPQDMQELFAQHMMQMQQQMMQAQMAMQGVEMMGNVAQKQQMQQLIEEMQKHVKNGEDIVEVEAKPLPEP